MDTLINALRDILGMPDFYRRLGTSTNYTWDYGAMLEYMVGAMIIMIVVSWVFRIVRSFFR